MTHYLGNTAAQEVFEQ